MSCHTVATRPQPRTGMGRVGARSTRNPPSLRLLTLTLTLTLTPALLAQLSFRRGEYAAAAAYAADALARFYPLATAWDKRRSFAHWVGFARMLHLRALRLLQGLPSLPAASTTQVGTFGASLHSIPAIVEQLP